MDPTEQRILEEIEAGIHETDSDFAARISSGPRLSSMSKAVLSAAVITGIILVMLFTANLFLGLVGYVALVAVGTVALRHRPLKPAQESPLDFFHRLTAGLFSDTGSKPETDET